MDQDMKFDSRMSFVAADFKRDSHIEKHCVPLSHEFLGEFSYATQDHTPTIPGIWEPTSREFGVVPKAGRTEKKSMICWSRHARGQQQGSLVWTMQPGLSRRMRVWNLKMGTVVINPRFGGVQILSQHHFSNKGDQAPRNKAMSKHFFDTLGMTKK